MNIVKFSPPANARQAEALVVERIKAAVYEYSGVISVAQAIGCLEIAKREIVDAQ